MKLAEELKKMIKESNEVISLYAIFGMEGKEDLENNHVTLMYFGDKSFEDKAKIESILDEYFKNNKVSNFSANFNKVEMFGQLKDVRVLTVNPDDKSKFLLDLRAELEPFNGSKFKEYSPHYTTDLPENQDVIIDKLFLSTTGYKTIKEYKFK